MSAEEAYINLCARHEFERTCGADIKYVSHTVSSDKLEFLFEIPALGPRTFVVGLKYEAEDIIKLSEKVGDIAQSVADGKLGKSIARFELAERWLEEQKAA